MSFIPKKMSGVYLTGHGGLEKLVYKEDIPVPTPKSGEVLIKVNGAGVNNTDINTQNTRNNAVQAVNHLPKQNT